MDKTTKWTTFDFSNAIKNAVLSNASNNFLSVKSDRVLFNGFWRNGDKQNICLWLDKATWHDAKTGEGGGCREFAKTAFNLNLPDFMVRYGQNFIASPKPKEHKNPPTKLTKPVHQIWTQLLGKDFKREDLATKWLSEQRGLEKPRFHIGSGFSNLDISDIQLFEPQHHSLINHRVSLGPQLVVPIRGVHSEQAQNLFIRALSDVPKEEKSRLLTGAGGWSEPDGTPRAFGFPALIHEFPNLVLCEGMADYFSAEFLLDADEKYLPIGAANADALTKWALWLTQTSYTGKVTIIFHIDANSDDEISANEIGPSKAIQAARILNEHQICVQIFPWLLYLKNTTTNPQRVRDLADSVQQALMHKECGAEHLKEMFRFFLNRDGVK